MKPRPRREDLPALANQEALDRGVVGAYRADGGTPESEELTMRTRELATHLFRAAIIPIAALCVVAATPLSAQQASDSARVSVTNSAPAASPSTALPGPRVAPPRFEPYRPTLAPSNASLSPSLAPEGGRHVIVLSTLTLVLIVIIVVLLIR
jgi:hypothetical protein